ncbi:putative quinol monooxygenase [Caenimonas soli]|uniref:putative quinol monooxygenase n=1 Tax=Caenimonas soli TaxID=2735555 RepID=UPI0015553158|nr:putative quinol monooxygenase [Caenimonas soli]NPC59321.1 antibiotic biosynthesis monooxygenase [Caenimonas soli]
MIHVIAIITAVEGARADLLKEIRGNRAAVLEEPGCIEYSVAVDAATPAPVWSAFGPDAIVIIEKWENRAALKAHAVAPHMVAYAARVKNLVASRAIHVLDPAL